MTPKLDHLQFQGDRVMDAFDDALQNLPGEPAQRVAALVDHLLPRLMDRAIAAGGPNENNDLSREQAAAYVTLLRKALDESEGCVAAMLVRVELSGQVKVAGASKGMKDEFLAELGKVIKSAVYAFAGAQQQACGCPACVAARSNHVFNGPKAEA